MPNYLSAAGEREMTAALTRAITEVGAMLNSKDNGVVCLLFYVNVPCRNCLDLSLMYESRWSGGQDNFGHADRHLMQAWSGAMRLADHLASDGHVSSSQSADATQGFLGGAAIVRCLMPTVGRSLLLCSIAGCAAQENTAIALRTLQRMEGWYPSQESFDAVVQTTSNTLAAKALRLPL